MPGLGGDDPILLQGYAAGLMLDQWFRFHKIPRDEDDATYQQIVQLRRAFGNDGKDVMEGNPVPLAEPSLIRLPHAKGTMPDREKLPTESELAESDYNFDESEEEGEVRDEGDGDGSRHKGLTQSPRLNIRVTASPEPCARRVGRLLFEQVHSGVMHDGQHVIHVHQSPFARMG